MASPTSIADIAIFDYIETTIFGRVKDFSFLIPRFIKSDRFIGLDHSSGPFLEPKSLPNEDSEIRSCLFVDFPTI